MRLSDLYDADRRTRDPQAARLASEMFIPHPLEGVTYADGTEPSRAAYRAAVNRLAMVLGWQVGGAS